jgi:rubrerythrin
MKEPIAGATPFDNLIGGIRGDVLLERHPGGHTVMRLLSAVEHHAALEADALGQYEQLAVASGDPVIALVMRLILDDEERHHGLLKRIAATLKDALDWTHTPDALPHGRETTPAQSNLADLARTLIEEERSGAQALRRLAQREKGIDAGLDGLLLEMMAMDSEKHAHLLRFVQRRLEARARLA